MSAPARTTIRARYSAGALHPLGALDLDEGEIVEIAIQKIRPRLENPLGTFASAI